MNIEERYKSSEANIKPTKYNTSSRLVGLSSNLDIDGKPAVYDRSGKLSKITPASSNLDIDITPKKYNAK